MKADALLAHLEKVRRTGNGRWIACCPAHADTSPSLSIRETDQGVILLHCFSECSVEEILGAVGLTFDALFPEKLDYGKPIRRPFPAADVFACIESETLLVAVASANIRNGYVLSDADHGRLMLAAERIAAARRIANG
jgi:hypothetical protein